MSPKLRVGIGMAAILSALWGRDVSAESIKAARFVFSRREMQRYQNDLRQRAPDSGISSGYFFTYGHYVLPPYEVTTIDCSTYVNGIRVHPLLELPALQPESARPRVRPDAEWWSRQSRLNKLSVVAAGAYSRLLLEGADTTRALAAAESVLKADSLVDSVRIGRGGFTAFGVPFLRKGKLVPPSISVYLPFQNGERVDSASLSALKRSNAEALARLIRGTLVGGRSFVRTWGREASLGVRHALAVSRVMSAPSLTDEQRWMALLDDCPPADAYSYVANRPRALAEWAALRERLGGGK